MNGFWAAGIVINLLGLAALVTWAVRNWRQGNAPRDPVDRGAEAKDPTAGDAGRRDQSR